MAEKNIRIGRVSSIDYGSGMISVTYPDLDDSVTDDLPVFSMGDEYKMPPVGAEVLVLHLSNGCAAGVVMGRYWNEANKPSVSGKGVFRKELGEKKGEAKGMREICLEMNFSKEDILRKLQDKLNISMQQASEYFEIYGKNTK